MSEVEPNEAPPGGYRVSLPTFEGPLDLLLHLCQKHELDILDIPIGFITEKYLEYLAVMQLLDLDLASEYLVMAATLAHIKSKMLLPAPPPGQEDEVIAGEEEDPRESLIRRLLEYQKYKQAAGDLVARGIAGSDVFLRGVRLEEAVQTGLPPLAQVPLFSLVEAFQGVLEKSKIKLSHDIVHERMTLTDRINELVDVLREKKRVQFEDLFDGQRTRFDLVITFLALLEMTKLRMTRLFQEHPTAPIFVEFAAQVAIDGEDGATALPEAFQVTSDGGAAAPAAAEATAAAATEAAPEQEPVDGGLEVRGDGAFATVPPPDEELEGDRDEDDAPLLAVAPEDEALLAEAEAEAEALARELAEATESPEADETATDETDETETPEAETPETESDDAPEDEP